MVKSLLWIALGGAVGSMSRFLLSQVVHTVYSGRFPFGTLVINALGSFLIGIVFVMIAERLVLEPHWRSILIVGFLGAFTTFSTFSLETVALVEKGHYSLAALYIASSVGLCLTATVAGLLLARHWYA